MLQTTFSKIRVFERLVNPFRNCEVVSKDNYEDVP